MAGGKGNRFFSRHIKHALQQHGRMWSRESYIVHDPMFDGSLIEGDNLITPGFFRLRAD